MKKNILFYLFTFLFLPNLIAQKAEEKDKTPDMTISEYFSNKKLDEVIGITPSIGSLMITGYDSDSGTSPQTYKLIFENKKPEMKKFESGQKITKKDVFALFDWCQFSSSIMTVPIKINPAKDTLEQSAITGLSNAGISLNGDIMNLNRYFASGKVSTHKVSISGYIAPAAIELNKTNTGGEVENKVNQLFISTGIGVTYTYNSLTFSLFPFGWDLGTTSLARDHYMRNYWFGAGIGLKLDPLTPKKP